MSSTRKSSVVSYNAGETFSARKIDCPSSLLAFGLLLLFMVCASVGGYFFCLQMQIHELKKTMDSEVRHLCVDLKKLRADVDRLASVLENEVQRLRQSIETITGTNYTRRMRIPNELSNMGLEESETTEYKRIPAGTLLGIEEFPEMTDKDGDGDSNSFDEEDEGDYIESENESGSSPGGSRTEDTVFDNRHPPVSNVQTAGRSEPASLTTRTAKNQSSTTDAVNKYARSISSEVTIRGIVLHNCNAFDTDFLINIKSSENADTRVESSIINKVPPVLGISANTTQRNRSINLLSSSQIQRGPRISKRNVEISSASVLNGIGNDSTRNSDESTTGCDCISRLINESRTVVAPKNAGHRSVVQSNQQHSTTAGHQTGGTIITRTPTAPSAKKAENKTKRGSVPLDSGNNAFIDAYQYSEPSDYRDYQVEPDYLKREMNFDKVDATGNVETNNTIRTRKDELSAVVAAHFGADSSPYNVTSHPQRYKGNGLLCHPTGEYKDWKPSNWHGSLNMHNHVALENGKISIRRQGLYWVYGQIFYLDDKDVNGYKIMKNSETVLQCITSSYSQSQTLKSNTCFTGGIIFCSAGDTLSITSYNNNRYVILEPSRSFFGVFKLGESQIP